MRHGRTLSRAEPARAQVDRRLVTWLLACAATVLATLLVGGATRLTHSGLSIVEWKPVTGVLPPLDDAAWQAEFDRYRATPEFLKVNAGMTLDGFRRIYWWEYAHRLVARFNGVIFALPLIFFATRGLLPRRVWPALAAIALLGGAQGALGWFMVQSGLVDEPRVSPLRLTAHLTLAFALFAGLVWLALDLRASPRQNQPRGPILGFVLVGALFLMVVTGGLVAGLRAGQIYNTFPLMDGHLLPPLAYASQPLWRDAVANPATAQFHHRLAALGLLCLGVAFALAARGAGRAARRAVHVVLAALVAQLALGALTVVQAVPVGLGVAHQAGAMVLLGLVLWALHEVRRDAGRFPPATARVTIGSR